MEPEIITDQKSPINLKRGQELLKREAAHTYKRLGKTKLDAHFLYPEDFYEGEQRTVIVFFHGGKWDNQMIDQFAPQALHFVLRGAVVVLAEYRVSSIHHTTPKESIEDAQSVILWLRENYLDVGIDPQKVIACGAGSGAHIALCAALNANVENNGLFDSRPNALVLYSAIINTTKKTEAYQLFEDKKSAIKTSPNRCIKRNAPPMIFYHGSADQTTAIDDVEQFTKKMRRKKNTCIFYPFQRGTHSFFNFNVNQQSFVQTLESSDCFMADHGYLKDAPEGTFIGDYK
ncbi:MAG: acetyl esterase [Rubritalea sp.]|jgi:acetyl esterase